MTVIGIGNEMNSTFSLIILKSSKTEKQIAKSL